ncbi:AraC family transcriptional regulator [Actinoplanes philippinensis]|uniref:Transcriptional regulator GlxA family, contains an amidase domain and an AraC-type DNA-binding HTH domain n=1 Tax=Actinoplanes philippinensis TaxID=35752 RepID=A0A1I2DBG4_9ACTN|nr:helix-turn-helix domain-containing protein [Actinoplanes philippinensis]GIE74346.1 AraC family transcriptional regulator [Actinoplanes philippinensis]SFE77895.1 Transcriptional regulator GlxA family, contains an amidase domain and an AraC-type DNA-binding HTH domain [Actinoplanes philippinensis]
MRPHRIAVLVLPGAAPLDVGISAQLFAPRHGLPYELRHCSLAAGPVKGRDGLGFVVEYGPEALDDADTVIVPGYNTPLQPLDQRILDGLRDAAFRGTRMVSICTGAFALAAAGILDGRRATTHWSMAPVLAREYPKVTVDPGVLFVDEGQVLSSAGVAAGIDLCLHLIRRDHGVQASNNVARRIVAAPYRSGGQSQFVPRTVPEPLGEVFAATREWALHRLGEPIGVADLARHAGVSTRTFGRRFVEDTGYTPMHWILRARIDMARELLECSVLSIEQIAAETGLGTGANLRMHFQRILDMTPTEYRKAFGGKLAGSGAAPSAARST